MPRNATTTKVELTTRGIRSAATCSADILWDAQVTGFGLRTRKSEDPSRWRWLVTYRAKDLKRLDGKSQQIKLTQPFTQMTPEQARKWASDTLKRANTTDDIAVSRRKEQDRQMQERTLRNAEDAKITGDVLWDAYWQAHGRLKRASKNYKQLWTTHLAPSFAAMRVCDVSPPDVERFKASMVEIPGACNRALALFSKMMSLAVKWGHRAGCSPEHPVKGVERYPEHPRETFFSETELGRIIDATDKEDNKGGALAIRMLALTGARAGEVTQAHWGQLEWIDEADGGGAIWTVESTNTKNARPVARFLDADLTKRLLEWQPVSIGMQRKGKVLRLQPGGRQEWLFPQAPDPTKPMNRLWHVWLRVRARAGLNHGRLHDFRHTIGTLLTQRTGGTDAATRQLGHVDGRITQRYAHSVRTERVATGLLIGQIISDAGQSAAAKSATIVKLGASNE